MINGWLDQIDDIYAGKSGICPVCKSKKIETKFYVFNNGIGFADFNCLQCGEKEHLSRIKYPDGIKIDLIHLDN